MARILAVDGGQSAIRLCHTDLPATTEVEGLSRAALHAHRLVEALEAGWRDLGSPPVERAVLGLTTAPTERGAGVALGALIGRAIAAPEVWVCDDAVTSHAGALSLGPGVSIVAGTGVACLVVPEAGEPEIVGGHGYLLGDEGGAFWMGREGLRAALRAADGRGVATALSAAVERRFGALPGLSVRLHDDPRPVNAIAQFATDVLDAAGTDATAARIVAEAANELHAVVAAAAARASSAGPVAVALGGRLLAGENPLRRALDSLLAADAGLCPRTADLSPLDGAMLLGRAGTPGRYSSLVHVWRREAAA